MSKKQDLNVEIFDVSCPKCGESRQFATTSKINQKVCFTCSKCGKYSVNICPLEEKEADRVVYLTTFL